MHELSTHPIENLHIVCIDLPCWLRFWKSGLRGVHLYYCLWQILLIIRAFKLHRTHNYDIIHHLTLGNILLPTFAPLINIPFIWGPLGGGETIPNTLISHFSISAKLQEYLRKSMIFVRRFNPLFQYCCRKAKVIIVKTEHTAKLIPHKHQSKVIQMTDVGTAIASGGKMIVNSKNASFRIICVGSMVAWRGFDIAIKAFARVHGKLSNASLRIVGDGPERRRLVEMVKEDNISDKVMFIGQIEKEVLDQEMSRSDLFINPCLKEGGITILMDAMQRGMPVICLDTGGINNSIPGIKIPLQCSDQIISMLAESLLKLGQDSSLRNKIGCACRTFAEKHTWDDKTRQLFGIYTQGTSFH